MKEIWNDYVWKKQKIEDIAKVYGRSFEWVRDRIDEAEVREKVLTPEEVVIVVDTTFFGRAWGVVVVRAPNLKKNIYCKDVDTEIMAHYYYARKILESEGWVIKGVVVDGKRGMLKVFEGIPVQMCQFHQMKNVTKYLTRKPETVAGQELRNIMLTLSKSNQKEFSLLLEKWHNRYKEYIKERTEVTGTKHWYYTHKKVRSAYLSLERNLPYLFTYQKYPELNIPNTTNSLDGSFVHLKDKVNIHHGLRKDRRYKMIRELLLGEEY